MPDMTFFWYDNNVKNLTPMAYAQDAFATIQAPQISHVGNEMVGQLPATSGSGYMGGSIISDEADLTGYTKLKVECSAATGSGQYSQIKVSVVTAIAQPLVLKDSVVIVNRNDGINSYSGIKETTLTETVARVCFTLVDGLEGNTLGNIHIKRVWAE